VLVKVYHIHITVTQTETSDTWTMQGFGYIGLDILIKLVAAFLSFELE